MRVLFVSGELIASDVAYRLVKEGCDVRLYIEDKSRRDCLENMVPKTKNWKKELKWVGKDGLIVFDDVGYGKIQDDLRKEGYVVFGECEEGDKLEKDREFAQKIFAKSGMTVEKSKDFIDINSAIKYIQANKARWVVKQNAHQGSLAYVGNMNDGSDVISVIESYQKYNKSHAIKTISLQKRVDGVEVAVARYFNGKDWTSPTFISFEHKPFLNGDIGPLTAEMGTIAWYDDDENNKLYLATLAKIKPYLQSIDYRGYVDINSIINGVKVVPLEATMRFGSPTNHLQSEMHLSKWKDLLLNTAKGNTYKLKHRKGYSIVVSVTIPPFPYESISSDYYIKGVQIFFRGLLKKDEWRKIHFEEVSLKKNTKSEFYIAGNNGYILYVTGTGQTVELARNDAYKLVSKIVIPKMMYRTDIGVKFIERDQNLLKEWCWI